MDDARPPKVYDAVAGLQAALRAGYLAYCLMTNHVHFVAVPRMADSLALTMRDTHQAYAAYLNRRLGQSGHLWQGRFYSAALDGSHLWTAVAYVERNPVRAGLVKRAEDYAWSSARGIAEVTTGFFRPIGPLRAW